jgi:hypothetical protein
MEYQLFSMTTYFTSKESSYPQRLRYQKIVPRPIDVDGLKDGRNSKLCVSFSGFANSRMQIQHLRTSFPTTSMCQVDLKFLPWDHKKRENN